MNPPLCMRRSTTRLAVARPQGGFSLVELMIALVLGLVMVAAFGTIYFSSQGASRRVEQLGDMQQSVRSAFEFFSSDVHAVGLTGCQQGRATGFSPPLSTSLANNFGVSIEGFEAVDTPTYPVATTTSPTSWRTNAATAGGTVATLTPSAVLGTTALARGSDVLVLRTVGSRPLRVTAAGASGSQVNVEITGFQGSCSYAAPRSSGFCAGNYGLIANCRQAEVFRVASLMSNGSAIQLTLSAPLTQSYASGTAEVFPLQTVMYYVRAGSRAGTQSLYRRIFDGDDGTSFGEEQELVEDVETLQVTYGVDNTDNPDTTRDFRIEQYVTANAVTSWSRVLAVRMSVLMRAREPMRGDGAVAASAAVNGVTINFPTTGDRFDRRVFTTTVALRNRVALN